MSGAEAKAKAGRALVVVAPAGPIAPAVLEDGLAVARELGLLSSDLAEARRDGGGTRFWLNGDDAARADELAEAIERVPDGGAGQAGGIWMARGGYGSARALTAAIERVERAQGARFVPASMWGFSDGTALVGYWADRGWESWHAPPVSQLPRLDVESKARLVAAVNGGRVAPFSGLLAVRRGAAQGRLVGGNLAVLCSLIGTPLMPRLDGGILVLEDVNEPAYRVDRMVFQLESAGLLDGVEGLLVGDFTGIGERDIDGIGVVFRELAEQRGWVCAAGLPVGHGERNASIPMGKIARLEVGVTGRLEVLAASGQGGGAS